MWHLSTKKGLSHIIDNIGPFAIASANYYSSDFWKFVLGVRGACAIRVEVSVPSFKGEVQLNYKRKLQIDQTVLVKTGST